ncbi:MAG: protein kinase [Micropepsaceae bacterium]
MADVFISFAPEDRAWVGVFAGALSDAGFDVLWDLAPALGQSTQRDVDEELSVAKAIIAVWSNASRNSNWVRDVAQEAFERGVLLPVLKDVEKPPLGFRQLRCADLRGWVSGAAGLDEVIAQLRGRVGAAVPDAALPVEPSQPSEGEELDFERSTIIMKSQADEASHAAPTQPSVGLSGGLSGASGAPSTSEKLVSVRMRGGGPGDLHPGDEIGQYRIVRRLGAGGFGAVYEAANIHNEDERVALKLLLADVAASERFAQLLKLEANALLRLKHPAVVQYRVFGRIADSDQFYLVTEFVPGPTLRDWRRANTPSLDDVRIVAVRLAQGLSAAHRRGIIHRDLAPDNVIIWQGDLSEATLIDFGIARMGDVDSLGGAFAGKFSYAAPEQFTFDGAKLGPSIDIYAFGLLMAAFSRGKPLNMGRDIEAAKARRLAVPPLDELPLPLARVLTHLLQPDPADRPQTMDEVARLFETMSEDAPPVVAAPVPGDAEAAMPEAPPEMEALAAALPVEAPDAELPEPSLEVFEKSVVIPIAPPETPAIDEAFEADTDGGSGDPVSPDMEPADAGPDEAPRRSPLIAVGQFVALAVVGAAAVFFLLPGDEPPPVSGPPVAEVTPAPTIVPTPTIAGTPPPRAPSPTATPTVVPTPTPTTAPTPSPVITPTPEATPEPTASPTPTPPPTPEAPRATGAIEAAPRGTKVQGQTGRAYGAQGEGGRIVYVARRSVRLTVRGGRDELIDRDLKRGDSYHMPDRRDLSVSASDAGALDVILDDSFIGRAGPDGAVLSEFNVTPEAYGGPSKAPPKPTPTPTAAPTPAPSPTPTAEPPPVTSGSFSAQALGPVNAFRQRSGVRDVAASDALDKVAQVLAANNARLGKIQQPSGSAVLQMLRQSGYGNAAASQLHSRRQNSAGEAVAFWSGRGDTATALTDPAAVAIGVGMAEAGGVKYWVLVIAQPPR